MSCGAVGKRYTKAIEDIRTETPRKKRNGQARMVILKNAKNSLFLNSKTADVLKAHKRERKSESLIEKNIDLFLLSQSAIFSKQPRIVFTTIRRKKMKKRTRKFVAGALSALMAATLLSGCGAPATSGTSSQAASQSVSVNTGTRDLGGLTLPIANGDVSITIMRSDGSLTERGKSLNDSTFASIDAIRANTGIDVQFKAYSGDAYNDALNTALASGSELPDVFVSGNADLTKLAKDGIVANLKDYINEENTPNLMRFFEKYPEVYGAITAPDGGIYGLPNRMSPYDAEYSALVLGYRKDWAENVGITEAPQTIEDWYNMLVAFRDGDPNGNGDTEDEIPFVCSHYNKIYNFSLAYGMSPWSNWFSVINDKVCYDFTSEENSEKAKAYLTEMNKWYKEGLLDPDINIDHGDKAEAMLLGNQGGAEANWTSYWPYYNSQMAADFGDVEWVTAMPPEGPFGDRAYENYPPYNNERWIITTANEHIVETLKLYDYVFATEEGYMLATLGVEGDTYTIENGEVKLTDKIINNEYGSISAAIAMETGEAFPAMLERGYMESVLGSELSDSEKQTLADASQYYRTMFPNVIATQEESDLISTKMTDIQTYQQEMFYKFILGDESLDNYDAFVEQLKSMGIDEVVAVKQAQYDRFIGK